MSTLQDLRAPSARDGRGRAVLRAGARPSRDLVFVATCGVAMLALFLLVRRALIDDAYITLSYARNLAVHLHWGLTQFHTSNTATSPVNVGLIALFTELTRPFGPANAVTGLGVESVLLAMVMAWGLARIVRALGVPFAAAVVAAGLVLTNPFVLSAIGLEVLLTPAVLAVLVAMAVERRPGWFGVAAGLALLTRLDLVIVVAAVALATPAVRHGWRRALLAAVLVAGPWFLFSWIALGSAVPDTLVIKTAQRGLFWPWGYVSGPAFYYFRHHNAVPLAMLPAVLGLFGLVAWLLVRFSVRWEARSGPPAIGPVAGLGVGGVAYYVVLSAMRLPPYHWYYAPPLVSLSLFLAIGAGAWWRWARERPEGRASLPQAVLAVAGGLAVLGLAAAVKQGVPWSDPLIHSNFASARDYERVGHDLRRIVGTAPVDSAGEVGTLAYSCDCNIIDLFSDRGRAVQEINHRIDKGNPVASLAYRVNYAWLDRSQKPQPVAYRLRYYHSAAGPNVWHVHSTFLGSGVLTLLHGP